MMKDSDRWILAGTWIFLAACGLGGLALIQRGLEPHPMAVTLEVRIPAPPPPARPSSPPPWEDAHRRLARSLQVVPAVPRPATDGIGCLIPRIVFWEVPIPPGEHVVLPTLIYRGTVELDRSRLSWKISPPSMNTGAHLSQPEAILIHRQSDGGELERVALLDPKATSYEDLDLQPGHTYRYWVLLRGPEGVKTKTMGPPVIDKEGEGWVEGRTPDWIKVRLIGGDAGHAILTVETYNPAKGRWEPSVVHATPGGPIGQTGWTLERTRFDRSTLVAELRDDRFEPRLISTRKE